MGDACSSSGATQGRMPSLFDLLGDQKRLVADATPSSAALAFALVSRECRDLMYERMPRRGWKRKRFYTPLEAVVGSVEQLRYARDLGCPWDARTCAAAAAVGTLDVLQYARANGCAWDASTASAAAQGGHLEVLRWAKSNGCPIETIACAKAARGGRVVGAMSRGELVLVREEVWVHAVWKDEEGLLQSDCEKMQQAQQLGCIPDNHDFNCIPGAHLDLRRAIKEAPEAVREGDRQGKIWPVCRWGVACPRLSTDESHTAKHHTPEQARLAEGVGVTAAVGALGGGWMREVVVEAVVEEEEEEEED